MKLYLAYVEPGISIYPRKKQKNERVSRSTDDAVQRTRSVRRQRERERKKKAGHVSYTYKSVRQCNVSVGVISIVTA